MAWEIIIPHHKGLGYFERWQRTSDIEKLTKEGKKRLSSGNAYNHSNNEWLPFPCQTMCNARTSLLFCISTILYLQAYTITTEWACLKTCFWEILDLKGQSNTVLE